MNLHDQIVLHEHRSGLTDASNLATNVADPAGSEDKAGPLKIGLDRSALTGSGHDFGHGPAARGA